MKLITIALLLCTAIFTSAQEFKDNLFATLKSSTLHDFYKSDYKSMSVSSLRKSTKLGFVEETSTTYRKGKINPNRINYSIKYSEYYILEDRKKSLGRYEFNEKNQLVYYERSDFNKRNIRTYTFKYKYDLKFDIVETETLTIVEYLSQGSAEMDTAMYTEIASYLVEENGNTYTQKNKELEDSFVEYIVEDDVLINSINHIEQVKDVTEYIYDGQNRLVRMHHKLTNEKGQSIDTETRIYHNEQGMVTEVQFYDENEEMLEKKVFTYK